VRAEHHDALPARREAAEDRHLLRPLSTTS